MEPTKRDLYFFIEGLRRNDYKSTQIHRMICVAFGDGVISERRVQEIAKEFSTGERTHFDRIAGSGRPVSDKRTGLIETVRTNIEQDSRISIRRLAFIHDTSYSMMYDIVSVDLECLSVHSRFVPHKLSEENKANRVSCSKEILKALNTRNIMRRLVHTDEKWIYCIPMGNSATRKCWLIPGGDIPEIARRSTMQKKFMIMVGCNFEGLFYCKVLNRQDTIDSDEYVTFLREMFTSFSTFELRQSGEAILPENMILYHDNARPHVSRTTKDFLATKNCILLPQPAYSPDTNILDRFVFAKMEMERSRRELNTKEEVEEFLQECMQRNTAPKMNRQFEKLKLHCQSIIDNLGNYVIH